MCRNIRCLHNFEPPTTDDEVREAALQFVRKVSGSTRPSRANAAAFDQAIDEIAEATRRMLDQLVTNAPLFEAAVAEIAASTRELLGALVGAVFCAGGVAIVAVLTLRAMGEWRRIKSEQENEQGSG